MVARELTKAGWTVWYDSELPVHRSYADVIAAELEHAPAVLVLWSKAAVSSEWVRSEANRARELHKLVQARLDAARLPMPFDQIQCADLSKWQGSRNGQAWLQVSRSIEALVTRAPANEPEESGHQLSDRRKIILGTTAVALAGIGGFSLWRANSHLEELSPQAQLLLQKGFDALQDNDALNPEGPGSTMQAIALLSAATEQAPGSALAWGGLALAYAVRKRTVRLEERPGLDMRSRAAARTALRLDPHEGRALGALLLLDPVYRHWLARERADRQAVAKNSSIPLLLSITSDMLGNVGRWADALSFSRRMDRQHFLIPGADRRFIVDLWAAGDLQRADQALQTAVEHWPGNPEIWQVRVAYLMYTGRSADALALLGADAERPTEIREDYVRAVRAWTEALAGKRPIRSAVSEGLSYLQANSGSALHVASAMSALGELEEMFEILEGYFFGAGRWANVAPLGGDEDRVTNALFLPPMNTAWSDRRFDPLLRRIGLDDYWQQSGSVPDFRRR